MHEALLGQNHAEIGIAEPRQRSRSIEGHSLRPERLVVVAPEDGEARLAHRRHVHLHEQPHVVVEVLVELIMGGAPVLSLQTQPNEPDLEGGDGMSRDRLEVEESDRHAPLVQVHQALEQRAGQVERRVVEREGELAGGGGEQRQHSCRLGHGGIHLAQRLVRRKPAVEVPVGAKGQQTAYVLQRVEEGGRHGLAAVLDGEKRLDFAEKDEGVANGPLGGRLVAVGPDFVRNGVRDEEGGKNGLVEALERAVAGGEQRAVLVHRGQTKSDAARANKHGRIWKLGIRAHVFDDLRHNVEGLSHGAAAVAPHVPQQGDVLFVGVLGAHLREDPSRELVEPHVALSTPTPHASRPVPLRRRGETADVHEVVEDARVLAVAQLHDHPVRRAAPKDEQVRVWTHIAATCTQPAVRVEGLEGVVGVAV